MGKDAVVQLERAFPANGCPIDPDAWVRAYFAAGDFRHVESVAAPVREMQAGIRHRAPALPRCRAAATTSSR